MRMNVIKFILLFCCFFGYGQTSWGYDDRDFNSPLWAVDYPSIIDRVFEIEDRLKKITHILKENFDEDDQDVEEIKFHIEQIRYSLHGFQATYGFRLP